MPDGGTLRQRSWSHILEGNEWFDGEREIAASARAVFADRWRDNKPATGMIWFFDGTRSETRQDFPTYQAAWAWVDEAIRSNERVYGGSVYPTKTT